MEINVVPISGNCHKRQRRLLFPRRVCLEPGFYVIETGRKRLGHVPVEDRVALVTDGMTTGVLEHLHLVVGKNGEAIPRRVALEPPHPRYIKFLPAHKLSLSVISFEFQCVASRLEAGNPAKEDKTYQQNEQIHRCEKTKQE